MNIEKFIKKHYPEFKAKGINNPIHEIRYILEEKLKISREVQIFKSGITLTEDQILDIEKTIEERIKGKPLSKIFKKAYFRDIKLSINKHVFSPRIDSEVLIDVVLQQKIKIKNVLELGTGSGALSISLLKYFKDCNALVTDISKEAIYMAKKNAILNNTINQMRFLCCDWLSCFNNLNFDILISNPPYVRRNDIASLEKEVKKHDPLNSIDGGFDGLIAYRKILDRINKIGKENLLVLFEIGFDQSEQVSEIMLKNGLNNIKIFKDYCNLPRCILGKT